MLFKLRCLCAPMLFLAAGGLIVATGDQVDAANAQKEKKDKEKQDKEGKDGPNKATKHLRKAYDTIIDLSQVTLPGKESARVFDHAKRFYREAVKAYPDDPRRAAELAAAANDAARGLEKIWRASAKPVTGLPEPPAENPALSVGPKGKGPPAPEGRATGERGPWSESLEALTTARERLDEPDAGTAVTGPARDVLDAAKAVYTQARAAYEGAEYRKAAELARAAEAWSHVPEHLKRAGFEFPAGSPSAPQPREKGAGAPPPPPRIKE